MRKRTSEKIIIIAVSRNPTLELSQDLRPQNTERAVGWNGGVGERGSRRGRGFVGTFAASWRKRGYSTWKGEQTMGRRMMRRDSGKVHWVPRSEGPLVRERIAPSSGFRIQHHRPRGPDDAEIALTPSCAVIANNLKNRDGDDQRECLASTGASLGGIAASYRRLALMTSVPPRGPAGQTRTRYDQMGGKERWWSDQMLHDEQALKCGGEPKISTVIGQKSVNDSGYGYAR